MSSECRFRTPAALGRAAFTLVELLVVIAIIGVLSALVAAAVTRVIPNQQVRNTERTIRKLNGELQAHWRAAIEDAQADVKRFGANLPTMQLAGGDAERAKVLWIKLRLVQQFPMSFWEMVNPGQAVVGGQAVAGGSPLPSFMAADPSYLKKLQVAGINTNTLQPIPGINPTAPLAPVGAVLPAMDELSACLFIALTAKGHRGKATQEDSFNADERGTAASGLPILVDSWRKPIGFARWPIDPTGTDPLDSTKRLLDPSWNNGNQGNQFPLTPSLAVPLVPLVETIIKHPLHSGNSTTNWTSADFFLTPVIFSAGLDGKFGVTYYLTPDGTGTDGDNIYSYLLK